MLRQSAFDRFDSQGREPYSSSSYEVRRSSHHSSRRSSSPQKHLAVVPDTSYTYRPKEERREYKSVATSRTNTFPVGKSLDYYTNGASLGQLTINTNTDDVEPTHYGREERTIEVLTSGNGTRDERRDRFKQRRGKSENRSHRNAEIERDLETSRDGREYHSDEEVRVERTQERRRSKYDKRADSKSGRLYQTNSLQKGKSRRDDSDDRGTINRTESREIIVEKRQAEGGRDVVRGGGGEERMYRQETRTGAHEPPRRANTAVVYLDDVDAGMKRGNHGSRYARSATYTESRDYHDDYNGRRQHNGADESFSGSESSSSSASSDGGRNYDNERRKGYRASTSAFSRSSGSLQRSSGNPRSPSSPGYELLNLSNMQDVPIEMGGSSGDDWESERTHERRVREIIPQSDREEVYYYNNRTRSPPKSGRFLKRIQSELDEKRFELKGEIDRLADNYTKVGAKPSGSNSYVDKSSGRPIFRAFFDVSEFHPKNVTVTVDKLCSKVIVSAAEDDNRGKMKKTFTQKVQMPRFADESQLRSKLTGKGILQIKVPLLYYFEKPSSKAPVTRSAVQEVKTDPLNGQQILEVAVHPGRDVDVKDLHVIVDGRQLKITSDVQDKYGQKASKLIKNYTLPELANLNTISSKLDDNGYLVVSVPLNRADPKLLSPPISESLSSANQTRTLKHEVRKQSSLTLPEYEEPEYSRRIWTESSKPAHVIERRTEVRRYDEGARTLPKEYRYSGRKSEKRREHKTDHQDMLDGGNREIRIIKTRKQKRF